MKLQSIIIKDFKRFTELSVQGLPETCRLIILAGPNGSGKSSFFDALSVWHLYTWRRRNHWDASYHRKSQINPEQDWTGNDVNVNFHNADPNDQDERKKALYFRSAHRNEPEFQIDSLQRLPNLLDNPRFNRMIDNDQAVRDNYQRLASQAFSDAFENARGEMTLSEFREKTIGDVRDAFKRLFPEVELNSLGDPLTNGTFRFTKGASTGFLFKNLSGGEKSAFDLILDLLVARKDYNDTVFCIDEPESHMNTRLQAELLSVLYDLTPDNCQLVLATHSIGVMRRAREIETENPGSVVFLDFGERDFDQRQIIEPIQPTRAFWERVYNVALDDIASLIAPSQVVVCEGTPKSSKATPNQSHDARCYSCIFEKEFPETRFISGGSASEVATDRLLLTEIIRQVAGGVKVIRLIDRDDRSDAEMSEEASNGVRVLTRRNLESYLFDDEVLKALVYQKGKNEVINDLLSEKERLSRETSGAADDLKKIRGQLYNKCKKLLRLTGCGNTAEAFMRDTLAPLVRPEMEVYKQLKQDIFGEDKTA